MGADGSSQPDEKTLSEAYTYLLGRVLVIRQKHKDRRGPTGELIRCGQALFF
jgi:hypothetical protein